MSLWEGEYCPLCGDSLLGLGLVTELNGQAVHLVCYEKWGDEQARLRQLEEDEL